MNSEVQLFALTDGGAVRLEVPSWARDVHQLFDHVPLGVYSGLATYEHQRFLRLDDHLARTERSAAMLRWAGGLGQVELRQALQRMVDDYPLPNCRVRFDLLRVPLRRDGLSSRLIVALSPRPPVAERHLTEGVALALTPLRRLTPLIKTTDFVIDRRVCDQVHPEAYEHLMLDGDGRILEGTSTNFFAVRDGQLWTAGQGVLEGITRKTVLELASALGIEIVTRGVTVAELSTVDEAFVTSSTREMVPVTRIAGIAVGGGRPGPVFGRLRAAYRRYAVEQARPAWPT